MYLRRYVLQKRGDVLMKIGIVLAGGMGKGAYEIGCVKAISEKFAYDDIKCISASSIGSLVAYSFASGQTDYMLKTLREIDIHSMGRFFPSFSGNVQLLEKIRAAVLPDNSSICDTYITVWNYTERNLEYVPIHKTLHDVAQDYLCASVAIPIFNKGVRINGNTHFDGAFIDNIPVSPLLEKNIDIIFCVYFDNKNYFFENENFDRKIIKLYDFPTDNKWENFSFDPKRVDQMLDYGYCYTKQVIDEVLSNNTLDKIYENIEKRNLRNKENIQRRFTCDVIMTNINKMTSRFAKRKIL